MCLSPKCRSRVKSEYILIQNRICEGLVIFLLGLSLAQIFFDVGRGVGIVLQGKRESKMIPQSYVRTSISISTAVKQKSSDKIPPNSHSQSPRGLRTKEGFQFVAASEGGDSCSSEILSFFPHTRRSDKNRLNIDHGLIGNIIPATK